MTVPEMFSLLIMPIGAVLIAIIALYVTRKDAEREEKAARDKHGPLPKHSH